MDPETIARRSNARLEGNAFHLKMLEKKFKVNLPEYEVQLLSNDTSEHLKVLLLDYLLQAEETGDSNKWIAFREIPEGEFYSDNFKRNTEVKLTQEFQGMMDKFARVAVDCGGESIPLGDEGFSFQALPRFDIALVFWSGGEEFRDRVNVLFEESAPDCLPTEGLAILGKQLCSDLIRTAEEK